MSPAVSIAVPVFNGSRYLREALDSALGQTFQDFEIVISDNASTDDTGAICQEYCVADPRIRYSRQERNVGGHRNFIIVAQQARAEFITWLAHDDILEPDYLLELIRVLRENAKVALATSDFLIVDADGALVRTEQLLSIRGQIGWDDRIWEFFRYPISNAFFAIYGLMRTSACRAAIMSAPEPKLAWASELPVLARVAVMGEIVSIPRVLRRYRRHSSSVYMLEMARLAGRTPFGRLLVALMNRYRLRFDQMCVLWGAKLPMTLKCRTSSRVAAYYLRNQGWYKWRRFFRDSRS